MDNKVKILEIKWNFWLIIDLFKKLIYLLVNNY